MELSSLNPVKGLLALVGGILVRAGVVPQRRVDRTIELAWPRIVTGLARMSKSAADVAMVGLAVGNAAIAGVGFASPFWGLAFALGGGVAGATISLVSQRYGANASRELGLAVRGSVLLVLAITLPLSVAFWLFPVELVGLIGGDNPEAIELGARYLQIVGLGIPLAGLNLVGSRTLVGADDAWTAMVVRAGGAVVNIGLNAALIFGLGMGVVGAALGTVFGNLAVTVAFAYGLATGHLPGVGPFPVRVPLSGPIVDADVVRDLVEIGTPLVFTNLARTGAQFPLLAIVALLGEEVVAAFVVARRIRGLMNTPGWGFSLASSSLVGQELGKGDESEARAYGRDVLAFALATYLTGAAVVGVFAEEVGRVFVDDPAILPLVTVFVYVACVSVVFNGINGGATGPLRASGDTRWPFYGQLVGLYAFTLPLAYLGATTALGIYGLYLALIVETLVPASITYYRYATGTWLEISRRYRPDARPGD